MTRPTSASSPQETPDESARPARPVAGIRTIRIAESLLVVVVIVYAAVVVRDYSRYSGHYPYLAIDDSLANVSYSLATLGRYGFMASPVQGFTDLRRDDGFFSYGPWYFFAGAALIWLFGYKLSVLRAMHPGGILAIAATSLWWFGRRGHLVAGAVVALGLIHSFAFGQWPMVRPDIAVSIFAVLFIVSAGLAIEKRSLAYWFVAGLGAGCAALTHLIAAALVPGCLATLAIALASERPTTRRAAVALLAVVLGLVAATLMFYGSFGFRIRDHLEMLRGYQGFLDTTQSARSGVPAVLAQHLRMAFWYLSPLAQSALAGSMVASLGLVAAAWRLPEDARQRILTLTLPPVAVVVCYGTSLGSYPNYHNGYVILLQVGVWWCTGAVVSALMSAVESRLQPARRAMGTVLAIAVVGVFSTVLLARSDANPRLDRVRTWVAIQDYLDTVAEFIPHGASVWGTGINGIDSPGRFELIEVSAALKLIDQSRRRYAFDSLDVAPQYLLWDYPVNRDDLLQTLRARRPGPEQRRSKFASVINLLPSVHYRLVGVITASPYGVTRVYERVEHSEAVPARLPAVRVYDVATQSWDQRLEGPIGASFGPAAPVMFNIDYTPTQPVPADRSVVADLPPGRYLLRVRVGRSSGGSPSRMVCATPAQSMTEVIGELGPSFDVSAYAPGADDAYVVHEHAGGSVYVSQFDNGQGASIDGVEVYRIRPTLHDDQRAEERIFQAMPALASWVPLATDGVRARVTEAGALVVEGNASPQGYQIQSPALPAKPGTAVTIRTAFTREQGTVCVGALNHTGEKWIANGGNPAQDFVFTMDDATSFRLVYYNCQPPDAGTVASRFAVSDARYAVALPGYYVDRLIAIVDPPAVPAAAIVPGPRVQSFPSGLVLSADETERITTPIGSADLQFNAPLAIMAGDGWTIHGTADARFSYLLHSKPQRVDGTTMLVVTGSVRRGGVTVGLLKNSQWAGQVHVTTPGEFIVVIEPPGSGSYDIVVANNLPEDSLETDVVIERLGWIR